MPGRPDDPDGRRQRDDPGAAQRVVHHRVGPAQARDEPFVGLPGLRGGVGQGRVGDDLVRVGHDLGRVPLRVVQRPQHAADLGGDRPGRRGHRVVRDLVEQFVPVQLGGAAHGDLVGEVAQQARGEPQRRRVELDRVGLAGVGAGPRRGDVPDRGRDRVELGARVAQRRGQGPAPVQLPDGLDERLGPERRVRVGRQRLGLGGHRPPRLGQERPVVGPPVARQQQRHERLHRPAREHRERGRPHRRVLGQVVGQVEHQARDGQGHARGVRDRAEERQHQGVGRRPGHQQHRLPDRAEQDPGRADQPDEQRHARIGPRVRGHHPDAAEPGADDRGPAPAGHVERQHRDDDDGEPDRGARRQRGRGLGGGPRPQVAAHASEGLGDTRVDHTVRLVAGGPARPRPPEHRRASWCDGCDPLGLSACNNRCWWSISGPNTRSSSPAGSARPRSTRRSCPPTCPRARCSPRTRPRSSSPAAPPASTPRAPRTSTRPSTPRVCRSWGSATASSRWRRPWAAPSPGPAPPSTAAPSSTSAPSPSSWPACPSASRCG